jgi:hypothetical protein
MKEKCGLVVFENLVPRRIFTPKKNVAGVLRDVYNVVCRRRCYATTAKWADIPWPFLGNGSGNPSPLLGITLLIMQYLDYNNGRAVFSMLSVSRGYKRDEV